MEPTYKSGQQDESRKSARDEEEEGKYRITKIQKSYKDDDEVEDSDDEIVLSPSPMRRESIMKSLRFMYAAHKDGRLKKRSMTPSPVPSREIVAPSPLIDQEVCMLNYVINEPPPENIEHQCLAVYKSKKQNICELIASMNSKISLSVDLWASSSHQNPDYYMVLTGHFIDDADWNIHHRILNVSPLPSDSYRNHKFIQVILTCLSNWNVRHRLFSLTVDDALCSSLSYHSLDNTEPIIPHLRPYCYARVISGLAQHVLGSMSETITKIRRSIQFVLSSQSRHNKFLAVKQHLGIRSKRDVILDEQAKWDTTYHMLVVALKLKNVFGCLSSNDLDYKIVVSIEEWKQVETLITYMNYFFQATKMVNAHQYAYADAFFPVVAKIQGELKRAANSEDPFIKLLTTPLHQKFEKYWESCYNLLAIAYILDPRVKLTTLHQEFSQIYGEQAKERAESVRDAMHRLWLEYSMQEETPTKDGSVETIKRESPTTSHEDQPFVPLSAPLSLTDNFDLMIQEWKMSERARKRKFAELSELDQYLEDVVYSTRGRRGGFDVLVWWKQNKAKYPTLSRMACDVLALPVSTLDYDFVFDTTAVKTIHSSLSPSSLEALICAKDWLK